MISTFSSVHILWLIPIDPSSRTRAWPPSVDRGRFWVGFGVKAEGFCGYRNCSE